MLYTLGYNYHLYIVHTLHKVRLRQKLCLLTPSDPDCDCDLHHNETGSKVAGLGAGAPLTDSNSNLIFQFSGHTKLLDQISFLAKLHWMFQSFHLKLLEMKESLVKFNGTKIVSIMFF